MPNAKRSSAEGIAALEVEAPRPSLFEFLADRDAFFRRYVLSIVLQPPPGMRRVRPRWLRR
jgi:hypothetical protein